ncbi:MAG: hypothetical protein J6U38_05185 [Clostridia bacterium]|nr:hypothetical protein [Clostridia bacterium]
MILFHLTITSSAAAAVKIKEVLLSRCGNRITSLDDYLGEDGKGELYIDCVDVDNLVDEVIKISKDFPGETILTHCFADVGCSYHMVDSEIKNGAETITRDERDLICD